MSNFYNSKRKSRLFNNSKDRHLKSIIRSIILKCDEIVFFLIVIENRSSDSKTMINKDKENLNILI